MTHWTSGSATSSDSADAVGLSFGSFFQGLQKNLGIFWRLSFDWQR